MAGWWKDNKMKNSIFSLFLLVFSIILFNGCKPDSGTVEPPDNKLTVTDLATLVKTPDQVIPWTSTETDSIWIVYTDVKWESIKIKDQVKRNLDFGNIGTFRFSAWANNDINAFFSSPADVVFEFSPSPKSYSKILNTISVSQPQNNPNILHYSTDSTFMVKGYKPFKWDGSKFIALSVKPPYDIVTDFIKVGNSYFWYARDNNNALNYFLLKSNLTFTDIKKVNEGSFGNLFFHSNDGIKYGLVISNSSITGYVFESSSTINQISSFPVSKLKEYKGSAYYLSDGSLFKLVISSINGTVSGSEIINKSNLDNQGISNYWIYGNQYFLFLSNNKLVSVKL